MVGWIVVFDECFVVFYVYGGWNVVVFGFIYEWMDEEFVTVFECVFL